MNKLKIYLTACTLAAVNTGAFALDATNVGNSAYEASISVVEDNISVTGTVTSQDGTPLPGVSIALKGTTSGTLTDPNGKFSIDAPEDGVLVFSMIGYATKQISINGNNNLGTVVLEKDDSDNRIVHTAFKDEKANEILGGVSYFYVEDVMDKNYFTNSLDNLYTFVSGYNGNTVWGYGALVLVDGIPRDLNNVKPDEI